MTTLTSTKLRAIGGASVLALTAGISGPAFASGAPAPAPTAPTVPGNAEECTEVDGLVTCVPGVDADGITVVGDTDSNSDDSDGDDSDDDEDGFGGDLTLDIQDGAYVQDSVVLLGDVEGVVDGAIVTDGDDEGALLLEAGSNVTINGFIQTSGEGSAGVEVTENGSITNAGTIYTTGDNASDGVVLGEGSSFTNSGLVRTDGENSVGVFGADSTEVINGVDGSIVTTGAGGFGVVLGEDSRVENSGAIQTFGEFGIAIDMGGDAEVVNNGSIHTQGEQAFGVSTLEDGSVFNSGTIATSGSLATAIVVGENSIVESDGTIEVAGDDAFGIIAGEGSQVNLDENSVLTTAGDFAGAVAIVGSGRVENGGSITTSGLNSAAIVMSGDGGEFINKLEASIVTTGDGAAGVSLGDDSYVQNDGSIATSGDAASGVEVGDDSLVVTNDSITTEGDGSFGVDMGTSSNLFNSGVISTSGAGAIAVIADDGSIVESDAEISTTGDGAIGIAIGDNGLINLEENSVLTTAGEDADGILAVGSVVMRNSGSITASGDDSDGVVLEGEGTVFNLAGGSISGAVGIDASFGGEEQTIANFGTITGTDGNAVLLGDGDDQFQQWDTGVLGGLVSAGDGDDTLVFGNASVDGSTRDLGDFDDEDQFEGFENLAFLSTAGAFTLTGESEESITLLGGDIILDGSLVETVLATGAGSLTVTETGSIEVEEGEGVDVDTNNYTITNAGTISSADSNAIDATDVEGLTVNNSGTITTDAEEGIAIFANNILDPEDVTNATINNTGTISVTGEAGIAVAIIGSGTVTNGVDGSITGEGEDVGAIFLAGDGTIDNDGSVTTTGDGSIAITLGGDAELDNSGDVSSDGEDTTAILLFAGGNVTNSGTVSGATGIDASLTVASNTVVNFGSITGTDGNAALLGDGDDEFQIFNGSSVDGLVDGGDGEDRLVFGNNGDDVFEVDIAGITASLDGEDDDDDDDDDDDTDGPDVDAIDADYVNFENVGFRDLGAGSINLTGDSDRSFSILGGDITLSGSVTDTLVIEGTDDSILTIAETGVVDTDGVAGILANVDGATVVNLGLVEADDASAIDASTVTAFTLTNSGTIQSGDDHAVSLNQGDITNSGLIQAVAGDLDDLDDMDDMDDVDTDDMDDVDTAVDRSQLAAISFEGEADEESTVTNEAGGVIRGEIGILAFASDDDDDDDDMDDMDDDDTDMDDMDDDTDMDEDPVVDNSNRQVVANFGTIEGTSGDAVALGDGDDQFQQWTDASVIGDIELEDGNDSFILEGRLTSVDGEIDGGDGEDTVILAGILDRDDVFDDSILENFENFELGSTLGGTLNDLEIEGDRSLENDFTIVGEVIFDLGVDSLTTDGTITLADTGLVTVNTPLDRELLGQTVLVLDGDDEEDLGGTINIIDDDQLLAYTPVGLLSVTVEADNPLADDTDRNLRVFGDALALAVEDGTLGDDAFDDLNDLPSVDAFRNAASDALPSLSEGVAREIFETASAASQAIAHPHATEGGGVWGQVMYRGADQDARTLSTDGYESEQLIFTAGADFIALDNFSLGVIGSYADIDNDDVDRAGVVRGNSDVESIKVGGYASAVLFQDSFVNVEVSYLTGDVEADRTGFFGDIGSEYDFDGYFARAEFGVDLASGDNVGIIPTIGFHHANINFDDTTETGGFGFDIERGDAKFSELRGGLEINGDVSSVIQAFAEATYIHDLEDSPRSFLLSSAEIAPFTAHLPLREQDRFEVAAGAMVGITEGFGLELGYLGDFADGYNAHSARANLRFAF